MIPTGWKDWLSLVELRHCRNSNWDQLPGSLTWEKRERIIYFGSDLFLCSCELELREEKYSGCLLPFECTHSFLICVLANPYLFPDSSAPVTRLKHCHIPEGLISLSYPRRNYCTVISQKDSIADI